jgi:hypothetical protein
MEDRRDGEEDDHRPPASADRGERIREIADRLTIGVPIGDAARRNHHAERGDEGRDFRIGDETAVYQADDEASEEAGGDRDDRIETGEAGIPRGEGRGGAYAFGC